MKPEKAQARDLVNAGHRATLHGTQRRTLEAIFRQPTPSNLTWMDVVGLVGHIGSITEGGSGEFDVRVGGQHHRMHKPHTQDLTGPEVIALRHFLQQVQWSPETTSQAEHHPDPASPTVMVMVDGDGAKVYRLDPAAHDVATPAVRPYDPHSLLHALAHKVQSMAKDQHLPEDLAFCERIADALAAAGRIVVVAHGAAQGPAARQLAGYLRTHHGQAYQRVVSEPGFDVADLTLPQVLAAAEQSLVVAA